MGRAEPRGGDPHLRRRRAPSCRPGEIGTVYFERPRATFEYHGDRGRPSARRTPSTRLADPRRRGPARRRRLPLPHRPHGLHDRLGRGQHLPSGDRGRPGGPPQGARRGGLRGAQRRDGRGGQGGGPAGRWHRRRTGAGRGAGPPGARNASPGSSGRAPTTSSSSCPGLDNGKLYKKVLRDPYWAGRPVSRSADGPPPLRGAAAAGRHLLGALRQGVVDRAGPGGRAFGPRSRPVERAAARSGPWRWRSARSRVAGAHRCSTWPWWPSSTAAHLGSAR